jgi:hypothetical protein
MNAEIAVFGKQKFILFKVSADHDLTRIFHKESGVRSVCLQAYNTGKLDEFNAFRGG